MTTSDPTLAGGGAARRPVIYFSAIDGVRAVAALAVFGFHAGIYGFVNGDVGVDIFFTLSGFLITSILLASMHDDGKLDFRRFYERRALRLLPAYLAVLAACVVDNLFIHVGGTLRGAFFSFFYVANWAAAARAGLGLLDHTWSLSIEEQFYLIWPALIVFLYRRCAGDLKDLRRAVTKVIAGAYASTVLLYLIHVTPTAIQDMTFTRAFELLCGCLLATFLQSEMTGRNQSLIGTPRTCSIIGWIAILGLLASIYADIPNPTVNLLVMWPVTSALTCGLIYSIVGGGSVRYLLGFTPLVLIGRASYGLYLWHFPVLLTIDVRWGLESWTAKCAGIAVTGVLTVGSYFLVERPVLRLKDRVYDRQVRVPQPPAAVKSDTPPAVAMPTDIA